MCIKQWISFSKIHGILNVISMKCNKCYANVKLIEIKIHQQKIQKNLSNGVHRIYYIIFFFLNHLLFSSCIKGKENKIRGTTLNPNLHICILYVFVSMFISKSYRFIFLHAFVFIYIFIFIFLSINSPSIYLFINLTFYKNI